jgi:PPOX class probable F420-dependent enzyme
VEAVNGPIPDPETLKLARGANFAAVTTLLPGGHPQTQITWIDTDGEHLLVNTPANTQKARNAARDPRITVTIWNAANPFQYAEVRGTVTEIRGEADAAEHINQVAHKYFGGDYPRPQGRAVLVITPQRQLLARPPR